jgi:hypothetical protein
MSKKNEDFYIGETIYKIDYDIFEMFLCEEEKKYFIEWYKSKNYNVNCDWLPFYKLEDDIISYYITKNGRVTFRIPATEYIKKYKIKERDIKLKSIGI